MTLRAVLWVAVSSHVQATDDKISLGEQERLEREYCAAHDWQVVDVLTVPGHSRSESDIVTLLEDYATRGIMAYHRVRDHWRAGDFDVLLAFDSSRLARSQTLYAFVIENVIKSGAKVHLIQGGTIDQDNVEYQIALGGISATAGVRRLVALRRKAMEARVANGLPQHEPMFSHRAIRDEKGNAIGLEVDTMYELFWLDLAELTLQQPRLAWSKIALEMKRRDHPPYPGAYLVALMRHPQIWGTSVMYLHNKRRGAWVYDPTAPAPPGVIIHYNKFPPVFTGELAERLKAELSAREGERLAPAGQFRFTGLIICYTCGCSAQATHTNRPSPIYRCSTPMHQANGTGRFNVPTCDASRGVSEQAVIAWLKPRLQRAIAKDNPTLALSESGLDSLPEQKLTAITGQIDLLQKKIDHWADELSKDLPERARRLIRDKIENADLKISELDNQRNELQADTATNVARRQVAFEEIKQVDDFWAQPPHVINRQLRDILSPYRLLMRDGTIVGYGKSNVNRGTPRKHV